MSDKPSIFISYSHENEEEMNFVYRHLRPLERYGKLECWHDREAMPGGKKQSDSLISDRSLSF